MRTTQGPLKDDQRTTRLHNKNTRLPTLQMIQFLCFQFSTTKESTKKTCLVKYDRKNKNPKFLDLLLKDPVISEKSKFYFETSSLKEKSFALLFNTL